MKTPEKCTVEGQVRGRQGGVDILILEPDRGRQTGYILGVDKVG